jgi:hypothetical protein
LRSHAPAVALRFLFALFACTHAPAAPPPTTKVANPRVAFRRDVRAQDGKPPPGADVPALALELASTWLRSPDPKLRDGVATDVLEFWIRRDERLDAAALGGLVRTFLTQVFAPLLESPAAEFDLAQFAAPRNRRNLLFTLFVQLSMAEDPTPNQTATLVALRELLGG